MLSRFTKLPGLSTLLSNTTHTYAQEDIDGAIRTIKSLGKREVNNSDECFQDIQKILQLTKKFHESLHVQRVSCHALSNLAMQVIAARWIIQKGGFKLIEKAIQRFHYDHKLCWLASSAIWNLARPPTNRSIIGMEGVKLMLQILKEHKHREKVTNTAIGALSNLSLQDDLKDFIASQSENLELILDALNVHLNMKSLSVMTSAAGLVANLAVNDEHASLLLSKNVLGILMQLLTWVSANAKNTDGEDSIDETLHRNSCAALNNLVTAEGFLDSFLKHEGIEYVFKFLDSYRDNELYMNLLENCLINIDADTTKKTTSFHLSCYHGKLEILKDLYQSSSHSIDLNTTDEHNMTALDYAIAQKQYDIIDFLCKCGATEYNTNAEHVKNPRIAEAIKGAKSQLKQVKTQNEKALIEALPYVPTDVCKFLVTYQHNVDMLKAMDLY